MGSTTNRFWGVQIQIMMATTILSISRTPLTIEWYPPIASLKNRFTNKITPILREACPIWDVSQIGIPPPSYRRYFAGSPQKQYFYIGVQTRMPVHLFLFLFFFRHKLPPHLGGSTHFSCFWCLFHFLSRFSSFSARSFVQAAPD